MADCHRFAKRIAELVEFFELKLVMVWPRRNTEKITLCDKLSKDFDLRWEVDWFASYWSHRLERFSS